jgi:hypothetical protein
MHYDFYHHNALQVRVSNTVTENIKFENSLGKISPKKNIMPSSGDTIGVNMIRSIKPSSCICVPLMMP